MFKWLRRKSQPQPDALPARAGVFSTDVLRTRESRANLYETAVAANIQRTVKDVDVVTPAGALMAMDSADYGSDGPPLDKSRFRSSNLVSEAQLAWYASQGFIGWQMCAILSQHWLIDKCCSMPAKDAARHGYEITVNDGSDVDPKLIDQIRKLDKRFKIKDNCVEFVRKGRVFGVRIAIFVVDGIDYEAPFNIDGVKPGSYRGISQVDPYWITPELTTQTAVNPGAMGFYEPEYWRIGGKRYHKSHLAIFRNGDVPDVLKPSYMFGGVPVPQQVAERVYAAERTANEAPLLALSKRTNAIHVDVAAALADEEAFDERIAQWVRYRDNHGIKILGIEETMEQFDTSLADFDNLTMTQYQLVAAAAKVPATKLLGTSPKGFNATGEFEEASYHEELESIQEHDLVPLVDGHHLRAIRSYIRPKIAFDIEVTANWNPVDSPTAVEQADLNLKKAQTGAALVQSGAIDGADERARLIADKDSGYNGMADIVPGGPGDREAEQERQQQELEANIDPNEEAKQPVIPYA